ncbi:MAG: TonB-dependent receptor [Bryobacterales bacterium]|nr:TonB-dependent receptor [Bryobacterales bacterium]
MRIKHGGVWAAILLVPCLWPHEANLSGRVEDSAGLVIPEATVRCLNTRAGISRVTRTDVHGIYRLPSLPPGIYDIDVTAAGFRKIRHSDLRLHEGQKAILDLTLEVGSVQESVTVDSGRQLVNLSTAEISSVVEGERVERLPLNGRNVLQLTLLAGGAVDTGGGQANQGFIHPSSRVYPSSSGGRGDSMTFNFDGGINNDRYTNVALPVPNPDAIQEFTFLVNNFSAEYGAASGGVISIVSRSGTSAYRGRVYNYLRNASLNATNFFTPGVSDWLRRNQAGFTLGGPVRIPRVFEGRQHTFFFVAYQLTMLRRSPLTTNVRTLTADERNGNFSVLAAQLGRPVLDPLTSQQFPDNRVPLTRLDPIMLKLASLLPVGDPTTGLATGRVAKVVVNEPQWTGRVDHNRPSGDRLTLRYFRDHYAPALTADPENPYLTGNGSIRFRVQNASTTYTKVYSPRRLGVFGFTVNRSHNTEIYDYPGPANNNPAALGIQGFPSGSFFLRSPFVAVGYQGPYTILASNNFQGRGSLTYITGRHELKFGIEYLRSQLNQARLTVGGNWYFGAEYTNIPQASFLMGFPNAFVSTGTYSESLRQRRLHAFLQDNYRVSRRLTLNLGMRFDPYVPWREIQARKITLFRPGLHSTRFPQLPTGAIVAGDPGVPEQGYASDLNNVSPRLGFAFDPAGCGKTSIRGGVGFFFGQPISASINQRSQVSYPFSESLTITSPGSLGPGGVANVFRTGTAFAIPNPYLRTTEQAAAPRPLTYVSTAADTSLPYTVQWNLSVERLAAREWIASVIYTGSKSTHLLMQHERNPPRYVPGTGEDGRPLSTHANIDARRPYGPHFGSVQEMGTDGNSNFNALTLKIRKTGGGHGWWSKSILEAHCTWSHTLDVMSTAVGPGGSSARDPLNERLDYANADFDHRHRFVLSWVLPLPRLARLAAAPRRLLGGWNTSAIVTLQDGNPLTVFSGLDRNLDGTTATDFADQILPNVALPKNRRRDDKIRQWFNTAAFTPNAPGTYGNTGRNILRGPGLANMDFALFKEIYLGAREDRRLEIRSDCFNLFNRVNLGMPSTSVSDPLFGRINSAGSPRVIQLALKLYF